jgi:hypothetical protein
MCGCINWFLGLTSMQFTLTAKALRFDLRATAITKLAFMGDPTLSFFLYDIRYGWGVGDLSGSAVPFWPSIGRL